MKSKKQRTDQIDEHIKRGQYNEAIPMLLSEIRKQPSDSLHRKLAKCYAANKNYPSYFSTAEQIEKETPPDDMVRQKVLAEITGQKDPASVEWIEALAVLAKDLYEQGNRKEAARMLVEVVNAWLKLYEMDQGANDPWTAFESLLTGAVGEDLKADRLDAVSQGKMLFVTEWFVHACSKNSAETLERSLAILNQAVQLWPSPVVYWVVMQRSLLKRDWVTAVDSYYQYLKTSKTVPFKRLQPDNAGLSDIVGFDAQAVVEKLSSVLTISEASEPQNAVLLPMIEDFIALLNHFDFQQDVFELIDRCPDWMLKGQSILLTEMYVDFQRISEKKPLEWVESYIKESLKKWPNCDGLVYRLGLVYCDQGNLSLAIPQFKKAVSLCPTSYFYQELLKKWQHIEMVSMRKSSERFELLLPEQKVSLDYLYSVGKVPDIPCLAHALKIPVAAAHDLLDQFVLANLFIKYPEEDRNQFEDDAYLVIGKQVFRIQDDTVVKLRRKREANIEMLVTPRDSFDHLELLRSVFRSADERLVYDALISIFRPDQFYISINMALSTVLDLDHLDVKWFDTPYEKDFYYKTSLDLCVINKRSNIPILAVEVDGDHHDVVRQRLKDRDKNKICQLAGLPLMRITYPNQALEKLKQDILGVLDYYQLLPNQFSAQKAPQPVETCPVES